ncbi:DNA-binding protein [Ktedonosporobacter rubrisoli]|uniref:DNA-binding protein n=1 Tax=Ktedonosporobacter rubrisoli TaxID=2509675 RepID=A0A4P6JVQ3_KTERU|nr:helix-turn-helix domain-containing protein [Ktedonosporobacter rubrisoli]QBD79056.1 DNA-binding protein [Ktedonosporobacter rubrisoli]
MAEGKKDPDQMLSARQAGNILGVSGKTVIRLIETGAFPGYKIGAAWKFRRGDIETYLASRRYYSNQDEKL